MLKYFNKLSLFLPMVKTINVTATSPYFNTSRFLSTTPRANVINSSQCLQAFVFSFPISKEQHGKYVKDFEETDKDKDGIITEDEFKTAIKKSLDWITDGNAKSIWDSNHGNALSLDPKMFPPMTKKDYIDCIQQILAYKTLIDEAIDDFFLQHDKDKDGKLDTQEACAILHDMDATRKKEEQVEELKKFDKDGDGKLTSEELKKFFWAGPGKDPFEVKP